MKRERGSVSIVVAAIILLALVLSLGVADVARVLVARAHARTAADAGYAVRNDAIGTDCVCVAGTLDATVTVSIVVHGFLLVIGPKTVTARARAVVDLPAEPPSG